jgi:uncharacterized protein (TIGR02996 family)
MAKRRPSPPEPSGRPTLLGLLHAVREEPDDDTPRLILADWLEDQHDPAEQARGHFIRLQCRLVHLLAHSPELPVLRAEEESLRRRWAPLWLRDVPTLIAAPWFYRGLIRLTVRPGELFSRQMANWLLTEPAAWVDHLQVLGPSSAGVARLAGLPLLGGLNTLGLWALSGGEGLAVLLASPRLAGLRELSLSTDQRAGGRLSLDLASWVASVRLPGLRDLSLGSCGLYDADLPSLFDWPGLPHVTALDLAGNWLGDALALTLARPPVLAGTPPLTSLTYLSLAGTGLTAEGVTALASAAQLARLRQLDLSNNYLPHFGLTSLAQSPYLAGLTHLRLVNTHSGSGDALALAGSHYLQHIEELDLDGNGDLAHTVGGLALRQRFGDRVRLRP